MLGEAPASMQADALEPATDERQEKKLAGWMRAFTAKITQYLAVFAGLIGSITVALSSLRVGGLPIDRSQDWWFQLPRSWVDSPGDYNLLCIAFYVGFALMTVSWLALGISVRAGQWRVRGLWIVAAIWALPWLVGPVALSTDVYTYLGQGLVQHAGLNPYVSGPQSVQLPAALVERMSPSWLDTPSPYGPMFLGIDSLIAPLSDGHLLRAVMLLRVVQLAGIVLAALSLPRVARAAGVDPAWATWLGVVSPLLLASVVLSAHNDGLMIGFIVASLALAAKKQWLPAIAVGMLAALVKIPAAVVVVLIAVAWIRQSGARGELWRRIGLAVATSGAVAVLVSLVSGVGTNWLNFAAVSSPTGAALPITPSVSVAVAVQETIQLVGLDVPMPIVLGVTRLLGVALAGLFALGVLIRQPRLGLTRGIGAILLVVVLASPVTWPWYLCWPLMLLGAATFGKARAALITLAALAPFVVDPNGTIQPFDRPGAVVIALITLTALAFLLRWSYRNLIKSSEREPTAKRETVAHVG